MPVVQEGEIYEAFAERQWVYSTAKDLYDRERTKWDQSNRKCLLIIKSSILEPLMGSIPNCDTAAGYLRSVESQYADPPKVCAHHLIQKLVTEKYRGGGIREHILKMRYMASKLDAMNMGLRDGFLVHLILASLNKDFEQIVNYFL